MAGTTVSFVADPSLAARVKEIARSDGVTQSQAAARASALGALLPASARRTLRFIMEEGGEEAQQQLAGATATAIARVANTVIERQFLSRAKARGWGPDSHSEQELADMAVKAVAEHGRQNGGEA